MASVSIRNSEDTIQVGIAERMQTQARSSAGHNTKSFKAKSKANPPVNGMEAVPAEFQEWEGGNLGGAVDVSPHPMMHKGHLMGILDLLDERITDRAKIVEHCNDLILSTEDTSLYDPDDPQEDANDNKLVADMSARAKLDIQSCTALRQRYMEALSALKGTGAAEIPGYSRLGGLGNPFGYLYLQIENLRATIEAPFDAGRAVNFVHRYITFRNGGYDQSLNSFEDIDNLSPEQFLEKFKANILVEGNLKLAETKADLHGILTEPKANGLATSERTMVSLRLPKEVSMDQPRSNSPEAILRPEVNYAYLSMKANPAQDPRSDYLGEGDDVSASPAHGMDHGI